MSSERIPDELEALYRADRARSMEQPPDAARIELEARLAALFVIPPGTPPDGGGCADGGAGPRTEGTRAALRQGGNVTRSLAAKAVGLIATGAVTGSVATLALRPPRIEVRTVEVERRIEVPVYIPSSATPSSSVVYVSPTRPPPLDRPAPSPPAEDRSLARERTLLEAARSAVARRDPTAALAATEAHAREFPKGRLIEEREALAVQTLVLADRQDEARSRAARFRTRFPGGFFLPVVDAAIDSLDVKK